MKKCVLLIVLLSIVCCLIRAQNFVDTLSEDKARRFKDMITEDAIIICNNYLNKRVDRLYKYSN
jgi:hypothetical protein